MAKSYDREKFTKRRAIICESAADAGFLRALITHHGIPKFDVICTTDFVKGVGGNTAFHKALFAIPLWPGFFNLRDLLLITDADASGQNSFRLVQRQIERAAAMMTPPAPIIYGVPPAHLAKASSQPGPDISILVVPWINQTGNLERLCWTAAQSVAGNKTACVTRFARCSEAHAWADNKRDKMRMRALLSVTNEDEPDLSLSKLWSVSPGTIPLNHPAFDQIVNVLRTY